ncbi:hypothetical protein [Ferrovum sp. PN-J185]|uniref:hypothetical protein n=1 Tax=Ferrovum sp. PN-J185 TaxID=1356306 RepID=UPI000797ECEB|nr:hypothetical protein [Ferrovum sp. PN-J185]KXW55933.1 hypothetical protein FV185_10930 [Ferrovum sp. PN-J185]
MIKRKWLILSHGFNMDGRAASLTITDKIPHLIEEGIEPVVLSAVTGKKDTRFYHRQILPWGPAGLRFDLRHLIAQKYGRGLFYRLTTGPVSIILSPLILIERLIIGLQSQWSWTPAAIFWGYIAIKKFDPELIYSTGGAYSAHWAGIWLKRITKKPWIAEIHDPMVFPGTVPKTRNLKFWAKLEGMICREANFAWWFTDQAMLSAKRRHPELGDKGKVILPGAEPPIVTAEYKRDPQYIHIGHFGSLSNVRTLKGFAQAFLKLKEESLDIANHFKIECYGGHIDTNAKKFITENQLEKYFIDIGRLEYDPKTKKSGREQIQIKMQEMDYLLIIHGDTEDCAEYIPSKFYDYLWAKRPIFAIINKNQQFKNLLSKYKSLISNATDINSIVEKLNEIYINWNEKKEVNINELPISTSNATNQIIEYVNHEIN